MGQVSKTLRRGVGCYMHWCPACGQLHPLPDSWMFDGNTERPTFTPSFRQEGFKVETVGGRWTGEWHRDAKGDPIPFVCHYILTSGVLTFCIDSTHHLGGKSVPLQELPEGLTDEE